MFEVLHKRWFLVVQCLTLIPAQYSLSDVYNENGFIRIDFLKYFLSLQSWLDLAILELMWVALFFTFEARHEFRSVSCCRPCSGGSPVPLRL